MLGVRSRKNNNDGGTKSGDTLLPVHAFCAERYLDLDTGSQFAQTARGARSPPKFQTCSIHFESTFPVTRPKMTMTLRHTTLGALASCLTQEVAQEIEDA